MDERSSLPELPSPGARGAYVLFFRLEERLELNVGKLGPVTLPPGWLVYVGSAMGPGGLRARLQRHFRPDKRLHWHIDYLTAICAPVGWHAEASTERLECVWVRRLLALPGAIVPEPGFGSSDCREGCPAHLLAFVEQDPAAERSAVSRDYLASTCRTV